MTADRIRGELGAVSLSPPDASWPRHFREERERLMAVLGPLANRLQHYGSTAVPGLDAKPIIDMMAPVPSLGEAEVLRDPLGGAGYSMIDVGFARRRFFRREPSGTTPVFHLHLAVSPEWPVKNELLFRDWLIGHPEAARGYAALKARLAKQFGDDMPSYTEAKTLFIRDAVQSARAARGLPPETDWAE